MSGYFTDCRVFWREFRENFHTTGAVLPSGRGLANALTRYVETADSLPRRILEVGPGTGAVTTRLIERLGANDRVDLVELNDRFVERLRHRFDTEPKFMRVRERARVLHQPVEQLLDSEPYDLVISGLPLNNFSVESVQKILDAFRKLLRPGGILSFFEYIAIRRVRAVVSKADERVRLRGIGQALDELLHSGEIRRDGVWVNVPPAWVHHVRISSGR
jgi:phospholipid N-methyltransferase